MKAEEDRHSAVFYWGFLIKGKQEVIPKMIPNLSKSSVQFVRSGGFFFLALNHDGQLWGWGNPKHCRFGIKAEEEILIPQPIPLKLKIRKIAAGNWHSLLIDADGGLFGCGHNKYGSLGMGHIENLNGF